MTFLHPAALALFASAAVLIFLAFLRARTRQQAVSSLSLWVGLTQVQERQAPKLHRWADPLLLIQLLALAALVFIIADPAHRSERRGLRGLALIVDETASMTTEDPSGATRFDRAVERAEAVLGEAAAARVTVIEFSNRSHIVVPPTDDASAAGRALDRLEPSWRADGTGADLLSLLSAVGGLDSYDRLVLFTDRPPQDLPAGIEVELFGEGENVGITGFTVRENPTGPGVIAFLELRNGTSDDLETRVTIRDEFTAITVTLSLDPESTGKFVFPFPSSRGVTFTATAAVADGFPADNVRYFALDRPASLQVRWIGDENRFLETALESTLPIQRVEEGAPADLTVVVGRTLDELPPGNILLLGSEVATVNRFLPGETRGTPQAERADDPLLAGVEPDGIYVDSLPKTLFLAPATPILTVGGEPLLSTLEEDGRRVFIFSTDLRGTNLPITVDFPILVRNLVTSIVRVPGPLVHEWRTVGEFIDAGGGSLRSVRAPGGASVQIEAGQEAFVAEEPGFYVVETSQGVRTIAVNVSPVESVPAPEEGTTGNQAPAPFTTREATSLLWPLFAWAALTLLAVEAVLYIRFDASRRLG